MTSREAEEDRGNRKPGGDAAADEDFVNASPVSITPPRAPSPLRAARRVKVRFGSVVMIKMGLLIVRAGLTGFLSGATTYVQCCSTWLDRPSVGADISGAFRCPDADVNVQRLAPDGRVDGAHWEMHLTRGWSGSIEREQRWKEPGRVGGGRKGNYQGLIMGISRWYPGNTVLIPRRDRAGMRCIAPLREAGSPARIAASFEIPKVRAQVPN